MSRFALRPSNFLSSTTLRPTYRATRRRITPPVCDNGLAMRFGALPSAASGDGPGSRRKEDTVARNIGHALSWVRTTPFGSPVEPEVSRINAGASASLPVGDAKAAASSLVSAPSSGLNRGKVSVGRSTAPTTGSSGSQIIIRVSMAAPIRATSSTGVAGCIATTVPPRHHTAAAAGRKRSSFPSRRMTRSPPARPPSRRPSSTDAAASCTYVQGPSSSTKAKPRSGRSATRQLSSLASDPPGSRPDMVFLSIGNPADISACPGAFLGNSHAREQTVFGRWFGELRQAVLPRRQPNPNRATGGGLVQLVGAFDEAHDLGPIPGGVDLENRSGEPGQVTENVESADPVVDLDQDGVVAHPIGDHMHDPRIAQNAVVICAAGADRLRVLVVPVDAHGRVPGTEAVE